MRKLGIVYLVLILILLSTLCFLMYQKESETNKEVTYTLSQEYMKGVDVIKYFTKIYSNVEDREIKFYTLNLDKEKIYFDTLEGAKKNIYKDLTYMLTKKINVSTQKIEEVRCEVDSYKNLKTYLENNQSNNINNSTNKENSKNTTNNNTNNVVTNERELKQGEVYGDNLIVSYSSHMQNIESGKITFLVIRSGVTKQYTNIDELKKDVSDKEIYKKDFELDKSGALIKYVFTKTF